MTKLIIEHELNKYKIDYQEKLSNRYVHSSSVVSDEETPLNCC